jgi:hypothetical protein
MADNNEGENMPIPCVEIPQNLSWIYSEKGQTFFRKVLNIVGLPASEVNESSAARTILSHTGQNIDAVVVDFLKEISTNFHVCYQNVEEIKCLNKKMTNLETSFTTLRNSCSIQNKWSLVLNSCNLQSSDATNILLNHVLQHFWSSVVLNGSCELSEDSELSNLSASSSSSTYCDDELENIEAESIQEHAGWVFKRARDLFKDGPEVHKIQLSKTNNVQVEVNKHFILSLIQRLGQDELAQPGRFLFNPIPEVLEVFIYLHNMVEKIVKNELGNCADKDILKKCLKFLSEDPNLRKMWQKLLGSEDNDTFCAGSVILFNELSQCF